MDKFLETHNLPGLNHEELENLKKLIMTNKIEVIIKNLYLQIPSPELPVLMPPSTVCDTTSHKSTIPPHENTLSLT